MVDKIRKSLTNGFLRNVGWQYLGNLTDVGARFIVAVILARALGAYDYGLIAATTAFCVVVSQIVQGRILETVVKFGSDFAANGKNLELRRLVKAAFLFESVNAILTFLVIAAVGLVFDRHFSEEERFGEAVVGRAVAFLFQGCGAVTSIGCLRLIGRVKEYSLANITCAIVNLACMGVMALVFSAGYYSIILAMAVMAAVRSLILARMTFLYLRKLSAGKDYIGDLVGQLKSIEGLKGFFVRNHAIGLVGIPGRDFDVAVLSSVVGLEVVGAYRVAKNLMGTLWMLGDPFLAMVLPEISKKVSEGKKMELRGFLRSLTLLLGLAAVVICVCAYLIFPLVIKWFFGVDFQAAITMFYFMGWALLVWLPFLWIHPLVLACGRPQVSLRAGIAGAVLSCMLYLAMVPRFGANGAALAFAFGHVGSGLIRAAMAYFEPRIREAIALK